MECVRTMANICKEAEAAIWQTQIFHDLSSKVLPPIDATHAVAIASVEASVKCLASAIIVITTSGRSAHLIAKYRPRCPIIAVTRFHQVARQAHLYRGILPLYYEGIVSISNFIEKNRVDLFLLLLETLYSTLCVNTLHKFLLYRSAIGRLGERCGCTCTIRIKLRQKSWFRKNWRFGSSRHGMATRLRLHEYASHRVRRTRINSRRSCMRYL